MIVIGLLVLIIAAAFGIDLIWKNDVHIANPTVFGERLGIHSAASLFVIGAITGAAFLLGVALLLWGVRRKGAHALSRHHERTEARGLREDREDKVLPEGNQPEQVPPSERAQPDATRDQTATVASPEATTASRERSAETTDTEEANGV